MSRLVVRTDDLAKVLEEYMEKHDARFPRGPGGSAFGHRKQDIGGFTAKQYLAFHSGKHPRSIDGILRRESEFTTLAKADALLTAIESTALMDGRMEVLQVSWKGGRGGNAYWSVVSTEAGLLA